MILKSIRSNIYYHLTKRTKIKVDWFLTLPQKCEKIPGLTSINSIFNSFFPKLQIKTIQILNYCYLKFENFFSHIVGRDTRPLKSVDIVFNLTVSSI